ncbi:hypothetical protein CBR_g40370 [Chara braunii]|uniref:Secreted protein n=1 Tax=Chara braunii TaxID=69332 RepID=A0A388LTP6_CHABU|nr:hypothetical protein CBR_g40370 [Chara braunii]|eukprot:GBG85641.1 hypothetical protein CBR_g40370 [Chara braunii]
MNRLHFPPRLSALRVIAVWTTCAASGTFLCRGGGRGGGGVTMGALSIGNPFCVCVGGNPGCIIHRYGWRLRALRSTAQVLLAWNDLRSWT